VQVQIGPYLCVYIYIQDRPENHFSGRKMRRKSQADSEEKALKKSNIFGWKQS
jgi:hypothetical protein